MPDQLVQDNVAVIRAAQADVRGHVDRWAVLAALAEVRGDATCATRAQRADPPQAARA